MSRPVLFLLVFLLGFSAYAQEFETHAVKQGETVESIARKYQVRAADIIRLNPEVKNNLPVNTILIIPLSGSVEKAGETMASQQEAVSFITHKVRRKETLYSIAKMYNVGVEDIKRYNKELYSRQLKRREKIRVPRYEYKAVEVFRKSEADGTKTYMVEAKEGKWRVAYKHGITIEELEKLNPGMGDVLKEGQELLVPDDSETSEKTIDDTYNYYVVQPREGFYRLKVKLGVEKEELERLNPELKEDGLKAGMVLKLPRSLSGNLEIEDGVIMERFNLPDSIDRRSVSNIALILPFKLHEMGMEDNSRDYKERVKGSRLLSRSLDFYTGALAALDTARQLGLSVNVKVLDSRGSTVGVSHLLSGDALRNTDAVIGPFLASPFNELAGGVRDIPVFLPFSGNIRPLDNIFRTVPDDQVLRDKMIAYIKAHKEERQVIVIADSKNAGVRNRLQTEIEGVRVLNPTEDKFIKLDDLKKVLSAEKENWVVVETDDVVMLTNVTGVLNSARSDSHKLTMFTTRKGNVYDAESISNFHLANLKLHYPTVDKGTTGNSAFDKAYESKFGTIPNRYATRGFDLTLDVILRLAYDKKLNDTAGRIGETQYVENKFNYRRASSGGYYNTGVYIVKYNDKLEIEVANF